ncbi:hypothetical protein TEA_006326 [Camellia sinensis var. sinensis]|uniref:Uncharacterized protein n=1 Tax=Camellia sinensis var. sinensis TaxID=542762 RepID=A0A4S4DFF1_CAMSN|nr:hypothetical protein TEA_006326 [Camellia sinensis var. sinensis]
MLLLILVALPIFLFFFVLHKNRGNGQVLLPPGPPGLPFIGNLHQLDNSAPHRYFWNLSKQYGPLMSLRLGSVPTLVVSSAKMAKEVMKTHDLEFSSRPSMVGPQKLSYNGLDWAFAPYNDYWRQMRKLCGLQLFNTKRVQSFHSVREEVHRMIEKISKLASEDKGSTTQSMTLSQTSIRSGSASINRPSAGVDVWIDVRIVAVLILRPSAAISPCCCINLSEMLMGLTSTTICRVAFGKRLSGLYGRLEKNFKEFDKFYQEIIDDHLDPKRRKSNQEDITDVLLKLQNNRSLAIDITFDHIKAVLMNIFFGGTDTSAATLVWAMTALMQEEVRNLVGEKGSVDEDDLQNLPYLKAVVKETMRLHPAVPLLVPRETTQTCKIDGYEIPPKTLVYVNAWAIGRDPEAWDNPQEFLPERFIGSTIDFKGQDFELVPFGAGRRGCPGLYMGAVQVELTLANLRCAFDWELPVGMKKEDLDTEVIPGVTMHKKTALCLTHVSSTFKASLRFSALANAITLKNLIRKGIPAVLRPKVWFSLSGAAKKKSTVTESYYNDLIKAVDSKITPATRQIDQNGIEMN